MCKTGHFQGRNDFKTGVGMLIDYQVIESQAGAFKYQLQQ